MKKKTTLNLKQLMVAALLITNVFFGLKVFAQNPEPVSMGLDYTAYNANLQNSGLVADETGITSINDNFLTAISIYPRPTRDFVNIRAQVTTQSNIKMTLIDMLGRVILQRDEIVPVGLYQGKLDLSNLANGVYLLEIRSGNQAITTKLIKN